MFRKDELKALLLVAADGQVARTNLAGIRFESDNGAVIAVATDGHCLLAIRKVCDPFSGFLSRADAEKMVKVASQYDEAVACDGKLTMGGITATLEHDGVFPNWRAVTPKQFSGVAAQFNPAYVADFGKVCKLLGTRSGICSIAHNGDGPALVDFGDSQAFGLLMPVRNDPGALPEWVHEPEPEAEAEPEAIAA